MPSTNIQRDGFRQGEPLRVCLIGAGPAALLTAYELLRSEIDNYKLTIVEAYQTLGPGMPYTSRGA